MVADFKNPRPKKYLNADALITLLRNRFDDVADRRRKASCDYSMTDTLTAALAMFSLKEPSLLSFEQRGDEEAIDKLFGIEQSPAIRKCVRFLTELISSLSTKLLPICFMSFSEQAC